MQTRVLLEEVTLLSTGDVSVKLLKQIVADDGVQVITEQPHRTVIPYDGDPDAQLDVVSAHLLSMGFPALAKDRVQFLKRFWLLGRTDPVIEAKARALAEQAAADTPVEA